MAKDRRSRDQKRKNKLAQRAKKVTRLPEALAYDGPRYRDDRWIPHVYATERPIYEAIQLSGKRLTNEQVREALTALVHHLWAGEPILLPEHTPVVPFTPGNEVAFLTWNIRRSWGELFVREGPVSRDDLVGILRTLLYSMEAQAWHRGPERGYVDFLDGFLGRR